MEEEMIAYCGVDCSCCVDFINGKCPGCRKTDWKEGDVCLPVECCRKKAISFCGQCPHFPCQDMKGFYEESDGHKQAFKRMASLKR